MYIPSTKWSRAFMLVTLVQALVSWALEIFIFVKYQDALEPTYNADGTLPPAAKSIPTYLALFCFGFLYEIILVWDALRLKNTIQIIGICLYNLGMLVYAAVETDQVNDAIGQLTPPGPGQTNPSLDGSSVEIPNSPLPKVRAYLIAAPCVIALGTIALGFIAWKLYAEFAWSIYKHVSADLGLRRRYLTYQIYIALLKFDFFFFLGFTVQFLVVVGGTTGAERGVTIAAIPVTIVILFVAAYITRRESYIGQCSVIAVYFAAMAYFIFKLVRMYDSPRVDQYKPARHSLTSFAILTLILLVVTIITAFFCMANFKKGLKPHIQRRKVPDPDEIDNTKYGNSYFAEEANGPSSHALGEIPARMTID